MTDVSPPNVFVVFYESIQNYSIVAEDVKVEPD